MKKTAVKVVEPKVDTDKVKRVYRAAQDTIKRLDEIGRQKRAYRDVFMPEAIHLRSRLQDYCERLMLYGPLEYGRKAEELLWRKVYYDVIQLMKHNRKQMKLSNSLESAFRTHLGSAMGYYHHLLVRLQSEFQLSLDGIVDFFHVPEPRSHQRLHQTRKTDPDVRVQEWATRACHRCLVYLGDLARYQKDYEGMTSRVISQRYYHEALLLCPQIGMPYNQLGTLAGTRYYNLDAAYHYFRCLLCVESFDGAQGNLTRLFEKNRKRYQELSVNSPRDLPPSQQRAKDIKRFLVQFLNLLDVLLTAAPSVEAKTLQDYCQTTLQQFNLCMLYLPPHVTAPAQSHDCQDERLLQYLEDDIVFKVVVTCMMTVYQLQTTGNKRVTAAIAFSLALFSHVLNHVVMRLQSALCELENPSRLQHSPDIDEMEDKEETEVDKKEEDTGKKDDVNGEEGNKEPGRERKPQKTHRLRRRRRCVSDSLSESAGSGLSSDESDLSEGERGGSIMPSICTADSDDEVVNFANQTDSDSDSEDNLMVSQELWAGFSCPGLR
ncbi:Protein SMG5 [Lamellibrachia satsuma]|nr:Protein SMG5 [Lamellibrachia satsuma]